MNDVKNLFLDKLSDGAFKVILRNHSMPLRILCEPSSCLTIEQERIVTLESLVWQALDKLSEFKTPSRYRMLRNGGNRFISSSQNSFRDFFHKQMLKHKDYLFGFLYRHNVLSDTNASERSGRRFEVNRKVFGLFRSIEGAQKFAHIRLAINMAIKNSMKVLEATVLIVKLRRENNCQFLYY